MTGTSSDRRFSLALAAIALAGFALRVFPFLGPEGAWAYKVDYDEGVYFSAAAYLFEGAWPYRDFVFVHPPGHLAFLALTSAWTKGFLGLTGAFALSRWVAALLGLANLVLVGHLVRRATGHHAAALFAAALYATYPEAVAVERGPFLEPLLNLACLGMTLSLLRASEEGSTYRPASLAIGGALAGLAVSIKLWALAWWLGAAAGLHLLGSRRDVVIFFRSALVVLAAIVLPFALRGLVPFATEVGLFHAWRPADGLVSRADRVEQIIALRHLASPLLALLLAGWALVKRAPAQLLAVRVTGVAWALTLAAFFASKAYWAQYNAHLVASEAVLAGVALSLLFRAGPARAAANAALAVLLVVSLGVSIFHAVRRSAGTDAHLSVARASFKDAADCIFTFEPAWSLAAGRLPPRLDGVPLVIDPYADQLLTALRDGRRFASADEAFAANPVLPPVLERCRYVVPGPRGLKQLSPLAEERLERTHSLVNTAGLQRWERL